MALGLRFSRRQRNVDDYFLGSGAMPTWAVTLSVVATETSALTVISIPGIGARGNLTFLQLAVGYLVGRLAVASWLMPGYFRGEQLTAYSRLEARFGLGTRRTISGVFLVTRFLADGVRVFAGAIPLALVTGWSVPLSILIVGVVTLVYTLAGGLKAVIWADVLQLVIYFCGGALALIIAWELAGGPAEALAAAAQAGKLRLFDWSLNLTTTYTFAGGLIGGALLSAASHGTDQLIVQRLLATGNLKRAQAAVVWSGIVVLFQFLLFLLVGSAIWAAGFAGEELAGDQVFPRFIIDHLPVGVAGLLIAGILAAAMSTLSSSINALASAVTLDFYAAGRPSEPAGKLLRVARGFSALWAAGLVGGALGFHALTGMDTPVVVLALSIASITYGALLGTYFLAAKVPAATGSHVTAAVALSVCLMLLVVFADRLAQAGLAWLGPLAPLAWPWYVPLGVLLTVATGATLAAATRERSR